MSSKPIQDNILLTRHSDSKVGVSKEGINKEQVSKEAIGTHTSALVAWGDNSTTFHDHPVVFNVLETRMTEELEATGNASTAAVVPKCVNATVGVLILTLEDGIMHDSLGRTAYIAGNFQWQFDAPPQAGAISTAGYTVCGNNSVALGSSAVWYQCRSGNFYNIYDRHWAPQCEMALMELVPVC